ncbi:MAG: hypothetical protein ACI9HA_002427, partial [Dinoroseobacter sp.]
LDVGFYYMANALGRLLVGEWVTSEVIVFITRVGRLNFLEFRRARGGAR